MGHQLTFVFLFSNIVSKIRPMIWCAKEAGKCVTRIRSELGLAILYIAYRQKVLRSTYTSTSTFFMFCFLEALRTSCNPSIRGRIGQNKQWITIRYQTRISRIGCMKDFVLSRNLFIIWFMLQLTSHNNCSVPGIWKSLFFPDCA